MDLYEKDKFLNIDVSPKQLAFFLSYVQGYINSFYPLIKNAKEQWLYDIKLDVSEIEKRDKKRVISYIDTTLDIMSNLASSIINYFRSEGYIKNDSFIEDSIMSFSTIFANLLKQFESEGRSIICKRIAVDDKYQSIRTMIIIYTNYGKNKKYLNNIVTPFHMFTSKKLKFYNRLVKMRATDLNLILSFVKQYLVISRFNTLRYIPFKEYVQSMERLRRTNYIVRPTNDELRKFWGFFIINMFSIVGFSVFEDKKKDKSELLDVTF